ncbi:hypothetical protein ACFYNO_26375 [Kitasatospora sp. NPDC006697]|uniref:hypothetical protein n=1 Tax=Kitasatospora sp. NPDC006697 TaxID=3364020 RepID=UPI003678F165
MKPPAELDRVPWSELTHAYGSAEDVPELIKALYDTDEETVDGAIYELYGNIHHQGSVYPASAPAVPFLAHAVLHAPHKRADLLMLLATLADHQPDDVDSPHWDGSSVAAICAGLGTELPELLPCLHDAERDVRRAALRVAAAVAGLLPEEHHRALLEHATTLHTTDRAPAVRADALVVLTRLGQEPAAALDSPLPEIRLAAALLAAERSGPPYPSRLLDVLAQDGAEPDPGDDAFPWPGDTTQEQQLTRLLTDDPDAGLAVAARWIAAGDLGSRGSWLVRGIAETWRDREPEVLELLSAALPQQRDPDALGGLLRTIGDWIEHLPEPSADLRDTLHRYATADDEPAEHALRALVRSRDRRAPALVLLRPGAGLIAAAALHFPAAADQLIPVIRRRLAAGATGNDGIALVGALRQFGSAARAAEPELVGCLRDERAAIVAARQLGLNGRATEEITDLLAQAMQSADLSLRAAAAAAHYQLTRDADPALRAFEGLLSARGQTHWYLSGLRPLGSAAAPLLPLIEPLLEAGEWTRTAAAEAVYRITGSPDRAVPVLAGVVGPTPVGLQALRALTEIGRFPEELRPTLRGLAFSPLRRLTDQLRSGPTHQDEELRGLARTLLALS